MEKLYVDSWFKNPPKQNCKKYTVESSVAVKKLRKGEKNGKSCKKIKKKTS